MFNGQSAIEMMRSGNIDDLRCVGEWVDGATQRGLEKLDWLHSNHLVAKYRIRMTAANKNLLPQSATIHSSQLCADVVSADAPDAAAACVEPGAIFT